MYSRTKSVTLTLGLFLLGTLGLSCLSIAFFKQQGHILKNPTIKYRDLVIDLGNGENPI